MTAAQGSISEDPPDPTTTSIDDVTYQTTGSRMTSSFASGADLHFERAVVVVAFVGTAANGLILYALVASKQHRKHPLIFNQNLLDFVSCFFLATVFSVKLSDVYLSGTSGYWRCAWRRGVVVSCVRRMNEVDARRARLVPAWVTVRLRAGIPSRYVTSQLGQLSLASLRGRLIEYQLRLG